MRPRRIALVAVAAAVFAGPASVFAHELDHPVAPAVEENRSEAIEQSGGEGAKWEFLKSFSTGNEQSDLDFFKQGRETFASVGTLAAGENGGQSIFQLTKDGGKNVDPQFVASHPSATCVSNPSQALGLQHDVEATPKGVAAPGDVLYNASATASSAVQGDTQLLIDATDNPGRCHDGGTFGIEDPFGVADTVPLGGLELIDVSNPDQEQDGSLANPKEIGLTSHIGEAHTVNVDPKRPHIAFVISSDSINIRDETRANESSGDELDGFEVVDMKSCLETPLGTLPKGATVDEKREGCRPEVFRYRYPTQNIALGHTLKRGIFACHETEIYANDRLTCGSGASAIVFDLKGAFERDPATGLDVPRGTPLPCRVRPTTSLPPFQTGAMITDCVNGEVDGQPQDLRVSEFRQGDTSFRGVKYLGSITHVGRAGTGQSTVPATEDIDFNHETELTDSGRFLLATDERGGGVVPPGATCSQVGDNTQGNGGVHAYPVDRLRDTRERTLTPEEAEQQYARTPKGEKAIFRAQVRTGAEASTCTAHVMQQVPGQNRIFMGWYSQGTQVIDFTENPDGTFEFKEVGFFIPANANQWVSHVFKSQQNADGTFTYHGAAGDFQLGRGRSSVEFFKVTLPAPPKPLTDEDIRRFEEGRKQPQPTPPGITADNPQPGPGPQACQASTAFRSAGVRPRRRGLRFAFDSPGRVNVDVFQQSKGRKVVGERLVARFRNRSSSFRWNGKANRRGRRVTNGYYVVRYRTRAAGGETRRMALQRVRGRFRKRPAYFRRNRCGLVRKFKLERPVFGGRTNRALNFAFRLGDTTRAAITVARANGRVVRRFREVEYRSGLTFRGRVSVKRSTFPRGRYVVTLNVRRPDGTTLTRRLSAFRV